MAHMSMAGSGCGRVAQPPLSPEERQKYRRSLHRSSCSPHWKGAYRERCKKRLRESRNKLLERFRKITSEPTNEEDPAINNSSTEASLIGAQRIPSPLSIAASVEEVVREEWEHVRMEYGNLPCLPSVPKKSTDKVLSKEEDFIMSEEFEADVELVLSIMDELTEELIKEEQALLAQYEEDLRFTEDALCEAVQSLYTDELICPICQKDYLHQNKHIIFCSCGLRLDTAQDGLSLDYIRWQLDHYTLEHSSQCRGKPQFSLETVVHTQTLIMNCSACSFMEIII